MLTRKQQETVYKNKIRKVYFMGIAGIIVAAILGLGVGAGSIFAYNKKNELGGKNRAEDLVRKAKREAQDIVMDAKKQAEEVSDRP